MSVKCVDLDDNVRLQALPTAPVAKVELCSITQLEWDLRRGCESWLMFLHPTGHMAAMEASMCAGVEGSEAGKPLHLLIGQNLSKNTRTCSNLLACLPNMTLYTKSNSNLAHSYHANVNIAFLWQNWQKLDASWTNILKKAGLGPAVHRMARQ